MTALIASRLANEYIRCGAPDILALLRRNGWKALAQLLEGR